MYDGFISYSHAADDLLAPRLQAGLQRFAKPWWRRRAVRMFRDESSLAANPYLWSSITEALDSSEWFVLLLSEEAATSEWVGREIEHWVANRDSSRILPVVTSGEFGWANGDVSGSSVPPALHDVFSEEPRWVDLRFAHDEEQLDLKNPVFAAAVADVASAIRGIPKDELASEEVRQHRRTIRTAWGAGILVAVLGVAAVVFGLQSQRSAQLARSQELAAAAASVLEADPELASLLAVMSIETAPGDAPPEAIRALRKADQANRLERRIQVSGNGEVFTTPDGQSVVSFTVLGESSQESWDVASYDVATGAENWRTSLNEYWDIGLSTALSPDGSYAVATGVDMSTGSGVLLVISTSSGEVLELFQEDCPEPGWDSAGSPFSPDGSVLALATGTSSCVENPEEAWISFRETTSWQEVAQLNVQGYFESVTFDGTGHFLVADWPPSGSPSDRLELRSYPDMELVQSFDGYEGRSALSPSGDRVAFDSRGGVRIHDATSGEFLGWVQGGGTFLVNRGLFFSPDGSLLLVSTEEGTVLVDTSNGQEITRLGSRRGVINASFSQDGTSVATGWEDQIEIWNLGGGSAATPVTAAGSPAVWVNPNRLFEAPTVGMLVFTGTFPEDLTSWLVAVDETTGETHGEIQAVAADQLPDGRFVILESSGTPDELVTGGLSIWDSANGSRDPITECSVLASSGDTHCPNGEPVFGRSNVGVVASPDGSMIAAISETMDSQRCEEGFALVRVWEVASKGEVATVEIEGCEDLRLLGDSWLMTTDGVYDLSDGSLLATHDANSLVYEMTADGRYALAVGSGPQTTVYVFDTSSWELVSEWEAHSARIRGMTVSPDGSRLATTGTDGLVRIWNLGAMTSGESASARLLDEIPIGVASDAYWISDDSLGVLFADGTWTEVTLDPDVLAARVLDRLQRSFTVTECENYRIDPCPTIEEMKSG